MVIVGIALMIFGMQSPFAQASALTGDYFGSVAVTSPEGLGNIDLAFHLEIPNGSTIDATKSYIILNKTILFPKSTNKFNGIDVGPMVKAGSTFNGTSLNLLVTPFTSTANGKPVTRTVTLTGASPSISGNTITGTYKEIMTNYLAQPITVTGQFTLVRPVSINPGAYACKELDLDANGELSLDEIKSGGKNPSYVEFDELSCAMYFYNHLEAGPKVLKADIQNALADYKLHLGQ
jgi:hypothetical protein